MDESRHIIVRRKALDQLSVERAFQDLEESAYATGHALTALERSSRDQAATVSRLSETRRRHAVGESLPAVEQRAKALDRLETHKAQMSVNALYDVVLERQSELSAYRGGSFDPQKAMKGLIVPYAEKYDATTPPLVTDVLDAIGALRSFTPGLSQLITGISTFLSFIEKLPWENAASQVLTAGENTEKLRSNIAQSNSTQDKLDEVLANEYYHSEWKLLERNLLVDDLEVLRQERKSVYQQGGSQLGLTNSLELYDRLLSAVPEKPERFGAQDTNYFPREELSSLLLMSLHDIMKEAAQLDSGSKFANSFNARQQNPFVLGSLSRALEFLDHATRRELVIEKSRALDASEIDALEKSNTYGHATEEIASTADATIGWSIAVQQVAKDLDVLASANDALAPAQAEIAEGVRDSTSALEAAASSADKSSDAFRGLEQNYQGAGTSIQGFAGAVELGGGSLDDFFLRAQTATAAADPFAEAFTTAADRVESGFDGLFDSVFDDGLKGFDDFGGKMQDIFDGLLSDLADTALRNPIKLAFTSAFGGALGGGTASAGTLGTGSIDYNKFFNEFFGTGKSVAGSAGPDDGLRGGAGGSGDTGYTGAGVATGVLTGAGIGYGIGSSTGLNTTGSTIGGAMGGAIGSYWPVVGTIIGSVAGSIIGGYVGKLIAGKSRDQQFSIATLGPDGQGARDAEGHYIFEGNRTRKSPFGTIGLLNADTSNTKGKLDESILDTIQAFDEAMAAVMDLRQREIVARVLQQAKDGSTQHASSIGEGDIGRALKDRLTQMAEGLIGRQLQGLTDQLAQINDRDVNKIQSEGQRMIEIIALFADGFERGLRALTGGMTPIEKQIFDLEEAAKDSARELLDSIEKIRDAVDLMRPQVPRQEDYTKVVERTVKTRVGEGDNAHTITKVIRETVPDVEAFKKAMAEARESIREHNKEQRQAERAIKQMALAAIGLGKAADEEPLKGAALALQEMKIRIRAMKPVLKEAGFTGEEAMEKIKKALEKAKKEMRKDFNSSIRDQILEIKDPFKAALEDLRETQKQRIADAKRLGGDLNAVHRLNALERAELEKRFAQESIDTIKGQIEQLDDFRTSLTTGPLTALSQREQLQVARSNFKDVARKALKGDLDVNEFASAARLFLEEQRAYSGSGGGFPAAFKEVLRIADKLGVNLEGDLNRKEEDLELRKDIREEAERDRKNRDENTDKLKIVLEDIVGDGKISHTFLKDMRDQIEDLVRVLVEKGQEDVA